MQISYHLSYLGTFSPKKVENSEFLCRTGHCVGRDNVFTEN